MQRMVDIDAEKIKRLDGSLLLVLRELLRQRRTTLAARRLGLSQSAVSHALMRLRELFGDPLFVRRAYGLEPTRHALELAPRVDALLEAMQHAMGLPSQFSAADTTRSFRVAAPDHVTTLLGPPLVERLSRAAPQARIAFSQRLGADAQRALLHDELDLALGRFAQLDERLRVETLYEDRYCLIARRDHPRVRGRLTAAQFARLDHVQVSISADFEPPEFAGAERAFRARRTVASVPRFLIAFAVVAQTQNVAVVPERLAKRYAAAFRLRAQALPFTLAPIEVRVVYREHLDPGVAFLLEHTRAMLRA